MAQNSSSKIKVWLKAFRLRTLPLAVSSIGMGSFIAAAEGYFQFSIFLWSVLTTIFLQVLSNLANDYGDSVHGADSDERKGPQRTVQSGLISPKQMKNAMLLFAGLAFVSGCTLLWVSFGQEYMVQLLIFLGLGLLAIWASITYTAGKNPYGYAGLGDISVLIFFGWVGVLGTLFLYSKDVNWLHLLPATSCGLLAVAVLNVNNIRDIESDIKAGKRSIPVRLGRPSARIYHWFLLLTALASSIIWVFVNFQGMAQFAFFIAVPLILRNGIAISKFEEPSKLDPFLKQMALATLLFVVSFGLGYLWVAHT